MVKGCNLTRNFGLPLFCGGYWITLVAWHPPKREIGRKWYVHWRRFWFHCAFHDCRKVWILLYLTSGCTCDLQASDAPWLCGTNVKKLKNSKISIEKNTLRMRHFKKERTRWHFCLWLYNSKDRFGHFLFLFFGGDSFVLESWLAGPPEGLGLQARGNPCGLPEPREAAVVVPKALKRPPGSQLASWNWETGRWGAGALSSLTVSGNFRKGHVVVCRVNPQECRFMDLSVMAALITTSRWWTLSISFFNRMLNSEVDERSDAVNLTTWSRELRAFKLPRTA